MCRSPPPRLIKTKHIGSVALLEFLQYLLTPWLVAPMTLLITALVGMGFYAQFSGNSVGGLTMQGANAWGALAVWMVALVLPGLLWGVVHRLKHNDEPLRALYRHFAGLTSWAKTERLVDKEPAAKPVPRVA